MTSACSIRVRGVVQGVGFRPFVFRLARENRLAGWVANGADGVEVFLEGSASGLEVFVRTLRTQPPAAAQIANLEVTASRVLGLTDFVIRTSTAAASPTTRISPDLPICEACLAELSNPGDPRFQYPYINCTDCGPRYSIVLYLPYDRPSTTMRAWPLDPFCHTQYQNPIDRRFHAQPVACPSCGPGYFLKLANEIIPDSVESIRRTAEVLRIGGIVAIKGIGGYHVACDARNATAIAEMRNRKFRKEKPFAVMTRDIDVAKAIAAIDFAGETLLQSAARPITLFPATVELPGVAPGNREIGIMLPYAPLHHLLFAAGAPDVLVMTSGNRSSEPIAYQDQDALDRLAGIADAWLIGERPIARRVDDSVVRAGVCGPAILRRSRGFAPGAVATLPSSRPILALGADLKNTIALVVDGQAFVSQHIGDLAHFQSLSAFRETIDDLLSMYGVVRKGLIVAHDSHPQYFSTQHAWSIPGAELHPIQHHRAHIASVLAERGEPQKIVIGICFDGTGFGDDGSVWGGEIFSGSLSGGFQRVAHLRPALLAGGDAAAQFPVQAAAGFLYQLENLPDLQTAPFHFPQRYARATELIRSNARSFATTSAGRLFDAASALLGFTSEITFEGQAAIALEQLATQVSKAEPYPFPFADHELDFRPALRKVIEDRIKHRDVREIARAFHSGLAFGLASALSQLAQANRTDTVVASGGVFQNELLLGLLQQSLAEQSITLWTNSQVPANDGGISLGQAALVAHAHAPSAETHLSASTFGASRVNRCANA